MARVAPSAAVMMGVAIAVSNAPNLIAFAQRLKFGAAPIRPAAPQGPDGSFMGITPLAYI